MIGKTIAGVIVVSVFLGPQIYIQYMMASTSSKVNRAILRTDERINPMAGKNLNISNHTKKGRFKIGYTALAQVNKFNSNRKVRFTTFVSPKNLLRPGEKMPQKSMLDLFAKTHAIYYVQEECKRLLKTLASKCKVSGSSGKVQKDGKIRISGGMNFIQKADFGSFDEKGRLAFQQIAIPVTRKNKPVQISISSAEQKRMSFYKKALRECAKIKRTEGNCALRYMDINSWKKAHSASMKMKGYTYYTYLQKL